jgi:hypothetical protein
MAARPVKSYAQMRAESGADTAGIACPYCGCTITVVVNTMRLVGFVRRYRQCVHPRCRGRFSTQEKA